MNLKAPDGEKYNRHNLTRRLRHEYTTISFALNKNSRNAIAL